MLIDLLIENLLRICNPSSLQINILIMMKCIQTHAQRSWSVIHCKDRDSWRRLFPAKLQKLTLRCKPS